MEHELKIEHHPICEAVYDHMKYGGQLMCDWEEVMSDVKQEKEGVCPKCGRQTKKMGYAL